MQNLKLIALPLLIVLLANTLLTGCSGLRRKYDGNSATGIQAVAIAGFETVQPVPPDLVGELFLTPGKASNPQSPMDSLNLIGMIALPSEQATKFYLDARTSLASLLQWKVADREAVRKNPEYQKLFKEWMGPIQSKTPVQRGESKFHSPEVLDYDSVLRLKAAERDALMQALNVDALAAIKINTVIHSATVMGVGNRYPQAVVQFQLFRKGAPDAVWFDVNAEGEKSKTSMGVTRITADFEKMNQLLLASARTAYRQLVQNTKTIGK